MVVDPATVVPNRQVPTAALLKMFRTLPELRPRLPTPIGFELVSDVFGEVRQLGPLLYCRKRHCIFAARSPNTAEPLHAMPAEQVPPAAADAAPSDLSVELLSWDGPAAGERRSAIYGGRGGSSRLGAIASLEQLLLDQGKVVALAAELERKDPVAVARLAGDHGCVKCPERERCYPKGDGYAYAVDRLVTISAVDAPLIFSPLGEWRFDEASRMIGGLSPSACLASQAPGDNDFEAWRAERAQVLEGAGPPRLLVGESDGRELIEVARLKLGLIAGVLVQLDAAWLGLQPEAPVETPDGRPLPYPPAFSDPALLAPSVVAAARHFDEPRRAALFVKALRAEGDAAVVQVLLEELGIPWELLCTSDAIHVQADGWQALLAPAAERNPDDGEGLPFAGRAVGNVAGLKKGEQIGGVECRWYPRFNEAVDLHAVGMLLLQALVSHDERSVPSFRAQLVEEQAELTGVCDALPIEQRDEHVRNWVTERCEADAPAAIWTRRNLLHRRDDRNATRLDAFPPALWQEIMTFALRLTTSIAGFSYCADRGCAAPRVAGDLLLPLVELRGLIALLDDQIFDRAAPGSAVREVFKKQATASWSR